MKKVVGVSQYKYLAALQETDPIILLKQVNWRQSSDLATGLELS